MAETRKYYGKYRGSVVNNIDPMRMGRVQVMVPDVTGVALSSWAMPCVPVAGPQMGFYTVPPLNAGVWVEFEQGDPDYPIWTGGFWGSAAEVPALAQTIPPGLSGFVLQTTMQNAIMISDAPGPTGGIMIKLNSGATILVNQTGITIQNGQGASITMNGPVVNVNMGALTVT
jgi:uncharacterized protein involved in type VI secretion and phage assembly